MARGCACRSVLRVVRAAGDQALEDMRLAAVLEKRVDAELELGREAELVGELEALVEEHPFASVSAPS